MALRAMLERLETRLPRLGIPWFPSKVRSPGIYHKYDPNTFCLFPFHLSIFDPVAPALSQA